MNATDETMAPPPPPPPSDPPPAPGRRLTRSTDDKVLTGLCGGLGRHFGVDPVVFRVAFVVLSIAGGTGVLLYLAGWLLIPDDQGASATDRFTGTKTRKLALALLVGIGIISLFDGWDNHWGNDSPVALGLIAVGALFLWSRRDRPGRRSGDDSGGGGTAPRSPDPTTPSPTSSPTSSPTTPMTSPFTSSSSPTAEVAPPLPPPPPSGDITTGGATAVAPPRPPKVPKAPKPPKPRSALVPVTLSLLAVLAGAAALAKISLATSLALALLLTGGALVVGAWRGRAKALIPVAVLISVGLGAAAVIDVPFAGGIGGRDYRPQTIADLQPTYRLSIGEVIVDLRRLDFTGRNESVLVTSAIGHVEVIVPPGVEVEAIGHSGAGQVRLFDVEADGSHVDRRVTNPGGDPSAGGGHLTVRARVGAGQVEVRRAAA